METRGVPGADAAGNGAGAPPPPEHTPQQGLQHRQKAFLLLWGLGYFFFFFFAIIPLRGKPDPVQETGGSFPTGPFCCWPGPRRRRGRGAGRCSGCAEGELTTGGGSACSGGSPSQPFGHRRKGAGAVGACVGQPSPPPLPSPRPRLIPGWGRQRSRGRAAPVPTAAAQGPQQRGWVASAPMLLLQLQ